MVKSYVPKRGDIVWVDLNPTKGHEQKGRRPALVLSDKNYNLPSQLMLVVPITSKQKGYPFEVSVHKGAIKGVILADQIKSLDWKQRNVTRISQVDKETLRRVQYMCRGLLYE